MIRTFLVGVMLLAAVALVRADDPPKPPKSPQPTVAILRLADGKLTIEREVAVTEFQPVQETRTVVVNGKQVTQTVTVMVPVTKIVRQIVTGEGYEVQDIKGQKIDPDKFAKVIEKEAKALLSADGKPIDPSYLKDAKEGTLILVQVKKPEPPKEPSPPK